MMDDFMVRALLAGLGMAVAVGPLGCLVVWRRMAYFGDALSHAALLGVAAGLFLGTGITASVVVLGLVVALLLVALGRQRLVAADTLLGIFSHAGLSFGMIALALVTSDASGIRIDLHSFLFGDILSVAKSDVLVIWGGAFCVVCVLAFLWRVLVAVTVSRDLALVEGLAVWRAEFLFMILMAVVVALAIRTTGVLLVTAMLIVPAATARRFAGTPEAMAFLSVFFAALSVLFGLAGSWFWDLPAGPSIVAAATVFCFLAWASLLPRYRIGRISL
ncbi:hypothetical protein HEQ60_09465 [Haematospirillum sp. H1815]|nr:hypothetical protein [Haematospirillum sp. H1815]